MVRPPTRPPLVNANWFEALRALGMRQDFCPPTEVQARMRFRLSRSGFHNLMASLVAAGLADTRTTTHRMVLDRRVYRITDAGRRAVADTRLYYAFYA